MKSILIDTNIFLRFFTQEPQQQFRVAKNFFHAIEKSHKHGIVSVLVIDEMIWAMEKYYQFPRDLYLRKLLQLFMLKNISFLEADKDVVFAALKLMDEKHVDFTDAYLFINKNGHDIFSFDNDFKKLNKKAYNPPEV